MAEMTPQEQLMLELINRARMDPNAEARRLGIRLNEGVDKGDRISAASKQVLAGNDDLVEAADNHSDWMLENDIFSHNEKKKTPGFTGKEPDDRMENAGYSFTGSWTWGENIAARSNSADALVRQHRDLFVDKGVEGRGHRLNILSAAFREIGIGQEIGDGTSMVTQDFARSGNNAFVTGVVYDDKDDDDFFGIGEETAGLDISTIGAADTTGSGGGYELKLAAGAGARTITFDLAGAADVTVGVTVGQRNIKLDLVDGDEIWTDSSITATNDNVAELHALGLAKVNFDGAEIAQAMYGNKAANKIDGNGGNDTLGGGRGRDELTGGIGSDIFVFAKSDTGKTAAKADTITDFAAGADLIDIDAMDADTKTDGNQDFTFIMDQKFHKVAGELRFADDGADTFVQGDTNGDGKADFIIRLNGVVTLAAGDFDL